MFVSDIRMSGRDGLSAAEELLRRDPEARVVFLTTFSDDEYIVRALKMDFLGLRTLGVISRACDNVKARHGIDIDPSATLWFFDACSE